MPHPRGFILNTITGLPKKARNSIYAGKQVNVKNRVSREYEVRSRKYVKPNVQKVHLYSQALGRKLKINVTTAALRAIDDAGGLDRYLLKTPDSLLHSDLASDLKFRLSLTYWHKQHQQREQHKEQQQQQPGSKRQQPHLAAVQAAQRQALAAGGGRSIPAHSSWGRSAAGSLLPPAAAAAAARTLSS